MITKSDWNAVHEEMMAADRRDLGAPPTAEELLAYSRGELDGEDAERMREILVAYPELARALTQPFADGAKPGDPGYLSDEQIAEQWKRFQALVPRRAAARDPGVGRVLLFWRSFGAVAAVLALTFGGLTFRLARELRAPLVITHKQPLTKDATARGGGAVEVTTVAVAGDTVQLVLPYSEEQTYAEYRLELFDMGSKRTLWRQGGAQPDTDQTFNVVVPTRNLERGREYQMILFGMTGKTAERIGTYSMRVAK